MLNEDIKTFNDNQRPGQPIVQLREKYLSLCCNVCIQQTGQDNQ